MDVLNCPVIDVGGRMYRIQASGAVAHRAAVVQEQYSLRHEEDEIPDNLIDDAPITQDGNSFITKIAADPELFSFVIGKEGRAKKSIEQETGATLHIPRREEQNSGRISEITIKASSKQAVSSARVRTEVLIDNALQGRFLDYTHFISIPLTSATQQFESFQSKVVADTSAAALGIDPSVFVRPQQLHLTIIMLKLYSEERRHKAKKVLDDLKGRVQELLGGEPLRVALRQLEYMNDDPSSMHVLYLQVKDQGPGSRLEQLCDMLVAAFAAAGLLLPQDDRKVKLHATLLNTRYRRQRGDANVSGRDGQSQRIPFDGRPLLAERGQLDFGVHALQTVHLSQRGKFDDTGYYHCVHNIGLL